MGRNLGGMAKMLHFWGGSWPPGCGILTGRGAVAPAWPVAAPQSGTEMTSREPGPISAAESRPVA
jgi:hypothetical protein